MKPKEKRMILILLVVLVIAVVIFVVSKNKKGNEENTEENHKDGWILDLHTGEFKYPMDKLNNDPVFWYGTKTNGEINNIKGTNIFWKVQNNMFVFWLE